MVEKLAGRREDPHAVPGTKPGKLLSGGVRVWVWSRKTTILKQAWFGAAGRESEKKRAASASENSAQVLINEARAGLNSLYRTW